MQAVGIAWLIGSAGLAGPNRPAAAPDYCDAEVRTVTPGAWSADILTAPSDAIPLFGANDLSLWNGRNGEPAWPVERGVVTVKKGTGDIETKASFRDIQLHLEWRIPENIAGKGQRRGNSGVFIQGRYEIQILDSYENRTYADGQAGAVYAQTPPLVNAMRRPGEWNAFDVVFTAPRFNDDGSLFAPARVTVLLNGLLIQNNTEIQGSTGPVGKPGYFDARETGPIKLQDHPDPSPPISFRNGWVRELNRPAAKAEGSAQWKVIGTATVKELLENPKAREVLVRCLPEVVPNPNLTGILNARTILQLKDLVAGLTEARLRIIDAELAR